MILIWKNVLPALFYHQFENTNYLFHMKGVLYILDILLIYGTFISELLIHVTTVISIMKSFELLGIFLGLLNELNFVSLFK